jgi:transcriptional regulator with XRE-family HTH domain
MPHPAFSQISRTIDQARLRKKTGAGLAVGGVPGDRTFAPEAPRGPARTADRTRAAASMREVRMGGLHAGPLHRGLHGRAGGSPVKVLQNTIPHLFNGRGKLMAESTENLEALRMVVIFLRFYARLSQAELGRAAGLAQSQISLLEVGEAKPSEDALRRIAAAVGVPGHLVAHLRHFFMAFTTAMETGSGLSLEGMTPGRNDVPAISAYWLEEAAEASRESPSAARVAAERFWNGVAGLPSHRRQRAIELSPRASRSWALAERLCHESERVAADDAHQALELAELALSIAGRVEGGEDWRRRLQGYAWAYLGNARRVANDLSGAREAFRQAWELWQSGSTPEAGLLEEERLLSLEASLR